MRFTSSATAAVFLLVATSALAAPVPRHHHDNEESHMEDSTEEHHHHRHHRHHHHHHHHHPSHLHDLAPQPHYSQNTFVRTKHYANKHVSHERIGLGKWIQNHMHFPHHWPFHPHHHQQVEEEHSQNKNAGEMFTYWLHSHFGPHTSDIRTPRGDPLMMQTQKSSSIFDSKPDPKRPKKLIPRHVDMPEGLAEELAQHLSEHGGEHDEHVHKLIHHEMKKLNKVMETEMEKARHDVHHAVKQMNLHVGMAAAGHDHHHHDHDSEHGFLEIDELD